ncbi:MAG: protein kinase [Acidobacteria bacterium]|nr:protein kinase [Acidobacteriota bacterium]
MSLGAGTRLGPYEIQSAIGAGGMGEVYRARDTRLDRIVAIKVLPAQFAADPQLRERFDREARAISSLNHPHICALFDVGRQDDVDFLVMEFLEGQTLAERLNSVGRVRSDPPSRAGSTGPGLQVDQALTVAIQVASALDAAHRAGIVHRDLKPANVMLTKAGAKLLDFGLAKTPAPVVAASGLSMMPTTPPGVTAQGTILGTFQYMAPEQIEGLDADARTDIFAFGALLFEMLTGKTAFEGKTRARLLGAILKDEPPPVSTVQPVVPKSLDRIISACLAKDPDDRWQSARDLLRELKWVTSGAAEASRVSDASPAKAGHYVRHARVAWSVAAVLGVALVAAAAIAVRHFREAPARTEVLQFTLPAPEGAVYAATSVSGGTGTAQQFAISPDGRQVAFVAGSKAGTALWIRSLANLTARPLPRTDQAAFPFWSPDSRFVAFFAGGKLKKVQATGGPPIALCDAVSGHGGTWNGDGVIVFAPSNNGELFRISSAGGVPAPVTSLDSARGERRHNWPSFLPDGRHFLYTAISTSGGREPDRPSDIRIASLDSKDVTPLFAAESSVAYNTGHLLFWRDGSLMAQPFDAATRKISGDPFPVAEQVANEGGRYTSFSVASTGVLMYAQGAAQQNVRLTWFDRAGKVLGTVADPGSYGTLALSPDERRVAVSLVTQNNRDIWVIDLARAVPTRLTFDPSAENYPIWSPDGSRVFYSGTGGIRQKLASGTDNEELVVKSAIGAGAALVPGDLSRDGRYLAYTDNTVVTSSFDLWVVPTGGDRKPFVYLRTPAIETNPAFSPDGRWLAYQSNESGQVQVYVQPFLASGGKYQISRNGGMQPLWRGDGKELFFLTVDGTIMSAEIRTGLQFEMSIPRALFPAEVLELATGREYAVTKDGQRFLVLVPPPRLNQTALTVVVNWLASVQK